MKRIVLGFLLFFGVFSFLLACGSDPYATSDGAITIELYDEEGVLVEEEDIPFVEGDAFFDLLQENFTVYCQDESGDPDEACDYETQYGVYVMGIDDVQAFDGEGYIGFYIDGDYATTGISEAELIDGAVYQLKYELIQ